MIRNGRNDMEFQEFCDRIYQVFSQTTGAEDQFWTVEEDADFPGRYSIVAIDQEESRTAIAAFLAEKDADFIASIHGALADMVRRSMEAIDDAARLELERDNLMGRVFDLELEIQGLKSELDRYEGLE
ncbi:hypothetical protein PBI_DYNAMIX_44 [Mycobacterium phage Dynamix]|uniref:Uncharacterized protein n=2 Tax=Fromanvirus TaxID=186764 RepID=G8I5Z0_9CAUD|nr:gp42 [Mycobacterium phage Bethlehem]YP_009011375.1 hypothetical protein CM08_gp42 [Mycobacterium phage Bruns]AMD43040.1 hypothetical protein PBI_DYNAMIX_44 [Mycobacterium phage Dynamix]AVI03579.1 hypothetical protein SEA_BEESKNEES_44 [Mycobacterium phage BeesKnees]AAR89763.1 hypothetical protein PBI_BETHLEHEM_43 [Mycobacterium phage Bethlehem]AER48134.1 hypothetical protein BRUNS_42 [Mycobacterium phage Bruns]